MSEAYTLGVHHVGLTVSHLQHSADFFTQLLGWKEIKRNEDYPAIFVSDGAIMLTLWKNIAEPALAFDKNRNIGLHHIAFRVASEDALNKLYDRLQQNKIDIEFAPEQLGPGPARHMMCFEPSGNRIEFIWPGH